MQKISLDGSPGSEQILFQLNLRQDWLGRLRGEARDKSLSGNLGIGAVHGSARWRSINFTWIPPVPCVIDFDGFRPLQSESAGGEALPIRFNGKIDRSGQSTHGKRRTAAWMMEGDSTKKIQVIIDVGRWLMQKRID